MNGQTVTRRHPAGSVYPENAKKLSVGYCMNDEYFDGLNLWITIRVTDAETIKDIESGKLDAVSSTNGSEPFMLAALFRVNPANCPSYLQAFAPASVSAPLH